MNRRLMLTALAALPLAACATAAPDHAAMAGMDHGNMPGMDHGAPADQEAAIHLPEGLKGPTLQFTEASVAFYVENDGTHLVAINNNGERMWRREPFVEYPIEGERASPIRALQISGYDQRSGHRVLIVRNATSFRGLDMISGDYVMG